MESPIIIPSSYLSSTDAAERYGLSNDHIASLCRRKKVQGALAGGRLWFVDEESLKAYLAKTQAERETRHRQLSEQIRREQAASSHASQWRLQGAGASLALLLFIGGSFSVSLPMAYETFAETPWEFMPASVAEASGMLYDKTFMTAAVAYLDFVDGVGDVQAQSYLSLADGFAAASKDTLGEHELAALAVLPEAVAETSVSGYADMMVWYANGYLSAVSGMGNASEYFYDASARVTLAVAEALPIAAEKTLTATAQGLLAAAYAAGDASEHFYGSSAKVSLAIADGFGDSGERAFTATAVSALDTADGAGAASERFYASSAATALSLSDGLTLSGERILETLARSSLAAAYTSGDVSETFYSSAAHAALAAGDGLAHSGEALLSRSAETYVDGVYAVGDAQLEAYAVAGDALSEAPSSLSMMLASVPRLIDESAIAVARWYKEASERVAQKTAPAAGERSTQSAAAYDALTSWLADTFFRSSVVPPEVPSVSAFLPAVSQAVRVDTAAAQSVQPEMPPVQIVVRETAAPGVTHSELAAAIEGAANHLRSLIYENVSKGIQTPQYVAAGGSGVNPSAPANRIDKLDRVTITNAVIEGYISGTAGIGVGGTGTTTAPSYGQLLLGNTWGGYDLVGTSSLGIVGGGGSSVWSTNGSQAYYTAGNVGIGTSTPSVPLAIQYSDNAYARGVTITNTNSNSQAISGLAVTDRNGTYKGIFDYLASNYSNALLQNTVLFGSVDNTKLGFIGGTGSGAPDIYFQSGANNSPVLYIHGSTQRAGVASSTPGSLFSIGNTNGINFSTATSTFSSTGGINLKGGCFAVNGNCISGGASSIDSLSDGKSDGNSTFLGAYAGENDDGSNENTGVGNGALYTNTSGQYNAAFGVSSLYSNETGSNNVAVGQQALFSNTSGGSNVGVGYYALGANLTGGENTAVGMSALSASQSGGSNTALGGLALANQNGGSYNVAIGNYAGRGVTGANSSRNTFLGYGAGYSNSTGSRNTFLGFYAGSGMSAGDGNIIIGNAVDAPNLSGSGQLNIGNLLYGTGLYTDSSTSSAPTAGKFAIGTTTPYARATIWGLGTGSSALLELVNSASTTVARFLDNGTAYFSGNVGFGTTTANWKVQAAGARPFFALSDTGAATNLKHWTLSSQGGALYLATSSDAYATSTIPALMIAATSNVGVGTTSPYAKLSVGGVVAGASFSADSSAATSTLAGGLNVGSGALTYDYSGGLTTIQNLAFGTMSFDTDAGAVAWFDMPVTSNASAGTVESYTAFVDGYGVLTVYGESDGSGGATNFRVGIGTSSPLYVLDVASTTGAGSVARFTNATGNCTINPTTTSLSCSSDERLKKDVEAIGKTQALAGILALRPVKYNWLTEEASTSLHSGFIAQEVNEIFPDLVAQGDNGYYTLNYGGFAPYLVSAVQQLAAVVTGFAEEFTTKKLCVEDVCVTREQFLKIVQAAGETPSAPEAPPESGTPADGNE